MARFVQKQDTNSIFYTIAIFIFVIFTAFTLIGEEGLIRLYELNQIKKSLAEENRTLLVQNLALRQELKSLNSPRTMEQKAHEFLGLAYPDEKIWLIPN